MREIWSRKNLARKYLATRKRKQVIRESEDRLKSRLQKQKNTKAITVPGKAGEKRKKKEIKEKRVKEKREES